MYRIRALRTLFLTKPVWPEGCSGRGWRSGRRRRRRLKKELVHILTVGTCYLVKKKKREENY